MCSKRRRDRLSPYLTHRFTVLFSQERLSNLPKTRDTS